MNALSENPNDKNTIHVVVTAAFQKGRGGENSINLPTLSQFISYVDCALSAVKLSYSEERKSMFSINNFSESP